MKNVLLSLLIVFFIDFSLHAQIAGPSSGGSFTVVTIPGSSQTWVNPGNAAVSDNIYTTFGTIASANGYTDYLVATNFGFAIPGGATITGILVEVERSDANFETIDNSVKIVKGGVISGDEKAISAGYPTTDTYQQYGNAGDTWGLVWTDADINASDFGVAISAKKINNPAGTAAGKIDNIRITVYYNNAVLPVDLISFTATKGNKKVTLNWKTVNEINMTDYEVQRSTDGNNFSSITTIPSRNSVSTTQYSFEDNNPYAGTSYYRLKMTGLSGYSKYSRIVLVQFDDATNIMLYPNPVAVDQTLHITNSNNEMLNVRFYDQSGKMILNNIINSDVISLSSIKSQKGLFIYQVTNSKGEVSGKGKIIIQ